MFCLMGICVPLLLLPSPIHFSLDPFGTTLISMFNEDVTISKRDPHSPPSLPSLLLSLQLLHPLQDVIYADVTALRLLESQSGKRSRFWSCEEGRCSGWYSLWYLKQVRRRSKHALRHWLLLPPFMFIVWDEREWTFVCSGCSFWTSPSYDQDKSRRQEKNFEINTRGWKRKGVLL